MFLIVLWQFAGNLWIEASAGTGKTRFLHDRFLFLMLQGHNPASLLGLTFTQAAALELHARLIHTLQEWVFCDPLQSLLLFLGRLPSPQEAQRASTLYHQALESDLRIQTFHQLCYRLLRAFPETPIIGTLLEPGEQKRLWRFAHDETLDTLPENIQLILMERFSKAHLWELAQERLGHHKQTDQPMKNIEFSSWIESQWEGDVYHKVTECLPETFRSQCPTWSHCRDFFLTEGKPRKRLAIQPWSQENIDWNAVQHKVAFYHQENLDHRYDPIHRALRFWEVHLSKRYQQLKQERYAWDYDDLILQSHAFFQNSDALDAIVSFFEGGVSHLCVDESQDTNGHQWRMLESLALRLLFEKGKTVCFVGDPKQSIYGFQGADLRLYQSMKERLVTQAQKIGNPFQIGTLNVSYRSVPILLEHVDRVFSEGLQGLPVHHQAAPHKKNQKGIVHLWPLSPDPHAHALLWSQTIQTWLQTKKRCNQDQRVIASDILILVRRRSAFTQQLITALQEANIPLTSRLQMDAKHNSAFQILWNVGYWVCFPDNNLGLDNLLSAPFFGVTQEMRLLLSLNRPRDLSLWEYLQAQQEDPWGKISRTLTGFQRMKEENTHVGSFYRKVIPVLFQDVWTPMRDVFLHKAWHWLGGLPTFLNALEEEDCVMVEDHAPGSVRLMTIHAAKGLQAPLVILPDLTPHHHPRDTGYWDQEWFWIPPLAEQPRFLKERNFSLGLEEEERLLYVALTRAEEELHLSGWEGRHGEKDLSSWYKTLTDKRV